MLRLVLENYLHFIQRKKHKAMFDRAEANEYGRAGWKFVGIYHNHKKALPEGSAFHL